jgi:two-component system sensor histidine kinase and response regulator WspE
MAGGGMGSMSLIDLFRGEVDTHAATLEAGLGDPDRLEELARAAHSIRGAARIVDYAVVSDLAGAMEQCLDEARAGKVTLGADRVAALRRGVALIREAAKQSEAQLAGWAQANRGAVETLLEDVAREAPAFTPSVARTDASLLDLFRMEAEAHTAALAQGLLQLENDPGHADLLHSLMRAAHSIKGAARVVNIDAAVELAHVIEDCFVGALDGRIAVVAEDIDLFLRGTDTLLQIARAGSELDGWLRANGPKAAELVGQIEAITRRRGEVAVAPRAADPGATEMRHIPLGDRSIRVTAQNINRLMNLAGESLVEARRLEPFAGALHKLSQRQAGLTDLLDDLSQVLVSSLGAESRAHTLVAEARGRAAELRHALGTRMQEFDAYARRSEDLTGRLYREAIACRMRPFADGIQGFPRMVRDLARKLDKKVDLHVMGETVGVDRDILEKLEAPLNHMLRNSIDHGIESPAARAAAGKPERGTLRLEARHWAGMLTVTIADDGRGIDPALVREKIVRRGLVDAEVARGLTDAEVLDYVFVPGFSTAEEVTEISGRGVGLDVVRSVVQEVGGSVRISSEIGRGTSFHLQLPITLSVIRAVVVEIAGEPYAFPLVRIERIVQVPLAEIRILENLQYFVLEGKNVGLVPALQVLELDGSAPSGATMPVVVLSDRTRLCGVAVDRFLGEHDLVIRPLDPRLGKVADISAAAVMTDGSPLLIIDVEDMVRSIVRLLQAGQLGKVSRAQLAARRRKRVLVVDDSITVREVQRQLLANRGYDVATAVDGIDGWHSLRGGDFDLVISDVDMPRMNGIDLVKSIKQDPRLRDTPVMIVSYKDRDEDRRRGLDAGANYYLTKSDFHDDTLLQAVGDLIGEPVT